MYVHDMFYFVHLPYMLVCTQLLMKRGIYTNSDFCDMLQMRRNNKNRINPFFVLSHMRHDMKLAVGVNRP
jgi:hypothetical protein